MEAIKIVSVSKSFGFGDSYIKVLSDVNMSVKQEEMVAIMGASGSGKSTLLNLMGGLDNPTKGKVIINCVSLPDLSEEEKIVFRRRNVGFVFQRYNLIPVLNVFENIVLPVKLDDKNIDEEFVLKLAEELGIKEKLFCMPGELSGGQQQRAAIARAVFSKPTVLLADEPTGNLDSATKMEVMDLLKRMNKKFHQTMVIVTHDDKVAEMADRVIQIGDGKVYEQEEII